MSTSIKKDLKRVFKEAKRQGWKVKDAGRRFKLYAPDGRTIVTVAKTPSVQRALIETVKRMQRAGFKWPPK